MAAGLIGLVSGGVLGYAGAQHRQKVEAEQRAKDFANQTLMEGIQKDPTSWLNPEIQKAAKKQLGEDTFNTLKPTFDMHAASAQRQAQQEQDFMRNVFGMPPQAPSAPQGTPMPTGSAPSSQGGQGQPAAPAAAPTTAAAAAASPTAAPEDFDGQLQKLAAAKAMIPSLGLPPDHAKTMESSIDALIKNVEEKRKEGASKDRQQAGFDQQEKMLGERKKVEEGLIGERAKVEEKLIGEREQASKDLEKYRADLKTTLASKADKPWTPKDSLAARKSTLDQAKAELVTTGWFGSVRQASGDKVNQRAAEIRLSEGLDPITANRLKDGDTVKMPDGKTYVWRDTK